MTIPSSRSLIFEVKSTGSELYRWCYQLTSVLVHKRFFDNFAFGRLRKSSEFFGRPRTSSGNFENDGVVLENSSTPRVKISRLYLRKSWQVSPYLAILDELRVSCLTGRRRLRFGAKLEAWRHKLLHIFHIVRTDSVLTVVNILFREYLVPSPTTKVAWF